MLFQGDARRSLRHWAVLTKTLAILMGVDVTTDVVTDEIHDVTQAVEVLKGTPGDPEFSSTDRNRSLGYGAKLLGIAGLVAASGMNGGKRSNTRYKPNTLEREGQVTISIPQTDKWVRVPQIVDAMNDHARDLANLVLRKTSSAVLGTVSDLGLTLRWSNGQVIATARVHTISQYELDGRTWGIIRSAIQELLEEKIGSVVAELAQENATSDDGIGSAVRSVIDRQLEEAIKPL